jgi:radical SAM protein with 4Fe4S-binding SPASM domain
MHLTDLPRTVLKHLAGDRQYQLARVPMVRPIYNSLRRWQHYWRYGVNSTFMFHNVELEVNSMCNRTCWYCPNSLAKRPLGYMEESLFRKIIDELREMDFDGTVSYHFYGEPLLDSRLPKLVEYTSRTVPHCRPGIYSNGDFLTLEIFRQYIRCGLAWFCITQHDNHMPPNLLRIMEKATDEERRYIDVRFVDSIRLCNRSGLIKILGAPEKPLRVPCDWPLGSIVVTMDGNVVPCCNDYFETEVVGNVRTDSLRQVWCGESFERFRRALSRGDRTGSKLCSKCDSIPDDKAVTRIVPQ